MHSFLGFGLVLLGLAAASFSTVVGYSAGYRRDSEGRRWAEAGVYAFALSMVLANFVMVAALLLHDFSVPYVAQVGSRASPTWVTIVSLWSSLEGSILFWGAILGCYCAAFVLSLRGRYHEYMAYAIATCMAVAVFFAFVIAGPANPFWPIVSPVPADGPGPNPLLQNHLLMIIHPPMLYLGYVGMTIPFSIAVAALLRGKLGEGWLKPLRRWTMIPWTFLTIGIVLGGWWAYEVLGWGGYWAWDPVENASFLPWLAATGYLHSTVAQERKRILKAWTLSMVLGAFLLTILGTFMTRSGVFNSVHSFTQSSIGPVFLVFLGICLIFSLGLLAGRSHLLEAEGRIESPWSREAAFMINNTIFAIFTFTVLLGTVYPLVVEALKGAKISVGEPYFDRMAVPIGLALVFMMGVGPVLPWGRPNLSQVVRALLLPGAAAMGVVAVCLGIGLREPLAIASFALCGFALWVTMSEILAPARQRAAQRNESVLKTFPRSVASHRRRIGGYVVHLSVIMVVAAIAGSKNYREAVELSLVPGESFDLAGYTMTYRDTKADDQPHRFSVYATIDVAREGRVVDTFQPRLNFYPTQREPIGTPDVRTVGQSDLYLSLLSFEKDGSRVGIKAYHIPMVPWLWWSIPVLVLGSLVSLWPRRRRRAVVPDGALEAA